MKPKSPTTTTKKPAPSAENSSQPLAEYQHHNEPWGVEDYGKLVRLFPGLSAENLAALHALAASRKDFEAPWGMLCRLCGIRPVIAPMGVDPAKLRSMPLEKVAAIYQVSTAEVELSVSLLQAAWNQVIAEAQLPEVQEAKKPAKPQMEPAAPAAGGKETPAPPKAKSGKVHFTGEQLDLLALGSFATSIFDYHDSDFDRYTEIEWFTEQIRDVRKVFEEPMAKDLAHLALLNQLQLRRINEKLCALEPDCQEYLKLQLTKTKIEETYGKQWAQVTEICPVAAQALNRKAAVNQLSDIVKAYREYKADPNNRPRDGIFTDQELQILFRTSTQMPEPQYRLGWVLAANEAKLGIGDPNWKRTMPQAYCKMLDASFRYAMAKMTEQLNVHRPDLEQDGPAGEYSPIHTQADGEMTDAVFEEVIQAEEKNAVDLTKPEG